MAQIHTTGLLESSDVSKANRLFVAVSNADLYQLLWSMLHDSRTVSF